MRWRYVKISACKPEDSLLYDILKSRHIKGELLQHVKPYFPGRSNVIMNQKLKTQNVDMLDGPIFKSLVLFALPILGSNIFQQLYNTVDTMIVGNCLGDMSLAAIGVCTPIYDLLVGFALGIGNGLAIVTARSYGSGDMQRLKRSVAASVVIGAGTSLTLTLIGIKFLHPLLRVLHTPEEIISDAYSYISVITVFIIVMFSYNLCAGLLRAIGNSFMPLIFLIMSSGVNIVLDIFFIAIMHTGIKGAAIATVISQGISVIFCVIYIVKKSPVLVPERKHFDAGKALYFEMLGQGLSMGLMGSIVSAGSVILQYGINGLGYLTIAGHTAARKLYSFSIMPFVAMAMAFSTFVSQNKGADKGERIIQATKAVYLYSVLMAIIIMGVTFPFASFFVNLLSGSSEAEVLVNGANYLRINAPFYWVLGCLLCTRNGLQGLGSKLVPLISSVIELIGKILFVTLFIPRYTYMAVILCEPVIWCVMTAQLVFSFFRNPYIVECRRKKKSIKSGSIT